ncbi:hypothetical protein E4656_15530 [Natronospirillum operosum]|uniref:GIY-YIG domain-containing protein n=1 Tax=Natronospirillum operosum TaxID=2759953 RepID=A0A4Z0W6L4_9GAMM|nr:hypothetical protein [Natronospirillum operosum]TGG91793.1 hypothetical protein E4656_15530 [Natronospirillum operosum]
MAALEDFANEAANDIAKYTISVVLNPDKLTGEEYSISNLSWSSIKYGSDDIEQVPDDQRGIYAFAICYDNEILPPHGYILYIGIAGRNSSRSLRERYKDYLNERKVYKRARIARMIGNWHSVLRFYYAPISSDVTSDELQEIEKELNSALLPTFSEGDLEADIKRKRRAYR